MENQNIKKRVRRLVKSMGHSVDCNITNRYIDAFPLSQQMEFNSRLLKLNDDADKGVDSAGEEFLKSWGNPGKWFKKSWGNRGFW